jgi:hypothetical protein
MSPFKHTIRFILAIFLAAVGIGGVYYFLNRSHAEWVSPLAYISSSATGVIEVKNPGGFADARDWSVEFSLNEGLSRMLQEVSADPQGIKFESQSVWIVENGSDDLIVLPVGYDEEGKALASKWSAKFPELKFLFQEPYAIYGGGNIDLPAEGIQLSDSQSFMCVKGTTSFDSNCHYYFKVDQDWTAIDDIHGNESSMIAGFQCLPLHLPASDSKFSFQNVFTNGRTNTSYWFKAVHAGSPLALMTYLDSLRPQDARSAFLSIRVDQEAKKNVSLLDWLNENATGELAMSNFGSDTPGASGMIYALGLKSDSVNVNALFSDSLAVDPIREANAAELFALDKIYPSEVKYFGVRYKNFFLFAESRELLLAHQQYLAIAGSISTKIFPSLPSGGIITGSDLQYSSRLSPKLGNGWRIWHYTPVVDRTQVTLVGRGAVKIETESVLLPDTTTIAAPTVTPTPAPVVESGKTKSVTNHITGKTDQVKYSGSKIEWISGGKTSWSATLSAEIRGLEQIDAFKNGKKQLLILTNSRLEMLDINGKNVVGYPVVLSSIPCTDLCVVDYSNARDYRIFFGCSNGTLYNYMPNGKPTSGWNATSMKGDLPSSIQYKKVNGQDEIHVKRASGKTTILKRNGAVKQ